RGPKVAHYRFLRNAGKVVFFGRFVAVLRTLAALLAGANRMFWPLFLVFHAARGIVWATVFGLGAYLFGAAIDQYAGPLGSVLLVIAIVSALVAFVLMR